MTITRSRIKMALLCVWLLGIFMLTTVLIRLKTLRSANYVTERVKKTTVTRLPVIKPNLNHTNTKFELNKETRLIDGRNYTLIEKRNKIAYLHTPNLTYCKQCQPDDCSLQEAKFHMITFVKSTVRGFARRRLIRRTWASVRLVKKTSFKVIFVVGKTNDPDQKILDKEERKHQDILQIDEPDDYRHLVLKSLASLQWASEQFQDNAFFSNTDDDMLIDVWKVEEVLDMYQLNTEIESWPEFPIVCTYRMFSESGMPFRDSSSKYYISKKRYKWPYWPTFCAGGMYTMSIQVVRNLWDISQTTDMLPVEDVWVTGILREKLGIPKEMVVAMQTSAAEHFEGFGTGLKEIDFYYTWSNAYEKSKSIPSCMCVKPPDIFALQLNKSFYLEDEKIIN